jgi:hypothetical protein
MGRRSRYNSQSTLSRLYDIGGADLALRYHEISERSRQATESHRPANSEPAAVAPRRAVYVNSVRISDHDVESMEKAWNATVGDGRYWYDPACGAWGLEGGPCAGFIQAGIACGGPLLPNASAGDTGVFINGRELHRLDVAALRRFGPVFPGRYWVDSSGNFGWQGGPAIGNFAAALQMPVQASRNPWTVNSQAGTVGGDGNGFLFFNDGKNFWST